MHTLFSLVCNIVVALCLNLSPTVLQVKKHLVIKVKKLGLLEDSPKDDISAMLLLV